MADTSKEAIERVLVGVDHDYADERERAASDMIRDLAKERDELRAVVAEIVSQIDQGGSEGKVFARDHCIERARQILKGGK